MNFALNQVDQVVSHLISCQSRDCMVETGNMEWPSHKNIIFLLRCYQRERKIKKIDCKFQNNIHKRQAKGVKWTGNHNPSFFFTLYFEVTNA